MNLTKIRGNVMIFRGITFPESHYAYLVQRVIHVNGADEDYRFYPEKLIKHACSKHSCNVRTDVLTTNHVHLLITPDKED